MFAVGFFDRLKIDDPVGAISVHLVNGVWGTLALGIFADPTFYEDGPVGFFAGGGLNQLWIQFVGTMSIGGMTVLLSTIFWLILKATLGIRVSDEEELMGLDIGEHGMEAYAGFVKDASGAPGGVGGAIGSSTGVAGSPQ